MPAERVILALAAVAATAAITAPPAGAASGCSPRGSRTVVSTKEARVFERDGGLYGCLLRRGKPYDLLEENETRDGPVVLSGRFAALPVIDTIEDPSDNGRQAIEVVNLRTGQLSAWVRTDREEGCTGLDDPCGMIIRRILLRGDGKRLAWLAVNAGWPGDGLPYVYRYDGRRRTLLDSGTGVDLGLLRLSGDRKRVVWRKDGVLRSAVL